MPAFVLAAVLASAHLLQEPSGLIPKDTALIVRLESLDAVYASLERMAKAFGAAEQLPPKEQFLSSGFSLPIDTAHVDPTRPVYMATDVVLGPPMPTFLLPARDVAGLTGAVAAIGKTAVARGTWLGFSMQPSYAPDEDNPRVDAMVPGVLSASIDLEEVLEVFGGFIEMYMQAAEQQAQAVAVSAAGFDMQAALGVYLDGFRAFLDSAESLDLALLEDGVDLALHWVYTAFEDSELDGWGSSGALPEKLPGAIDPEAQIAIVMVADWSELLQRMRPVVDAMLGAFPAESKAGFEAYRTSIGEAYALLGDTAVASAGFGEQGIHVAFYATADESQAFLDKLAAAASNAAAFTSSMGVSVGAPQAVEIGGLKAQQWPLTIDYQRLMPAAGASATPEEAAQVEELLRRLYGEHPTLTLAAQADRVCVVFGGGPADLERDFARFTAGPVPAQPFLSGLHGLPAAARPLVVYRADLARVTRALGPLFAAQGVPAEFPDAPLSITTWLAIEGRRWHGGIGAPLDEIAGMVEAVEEAEGD